VTGKARQEPEWNRHHARLAEQEDPDPERSTLPAWQGQQPGGEDAELESAWKGLAKDLGET
jgi:hypothetical protein